MSFFFFKEDKHSVSQSLFYLVKDILWLLLIIGGDTGGHSSDAIFTKAVMLL